jgi:hypothetical protein
MGKHLIRNKDEAPSGFNSEVVTKGVHRSSISHNVTHINESTNPQSKQKQGRSNTKFKGHGMKVFNLHARQIKSINRSFSKKKPKSTSPITSIRKRISSKLRKYKNSSKYLHRDADPRSYSTYHDNLGVSATTTNSFISKILDSHPKKDFLNRFQNETNLRLERRLQRKKNKIKQDKKEVLQFTPKRKNQRRGKREVEQLLIERRKEFIREQMAKARGPRVFESNVAKPIVIDEPNDEEDEEFFSKDTDLREKLFGEQDSTKKFTDHLEKQLLLIRQQMTNKNYFSKLEDSGTKLI